nr:hypothetical protein [uncultured Cohaesibacter sp.]
MSQNRVVVNDLPFEPQVRPAPIQSDTYAAPARPARDTRFEQLAGALGSFNGALGSLASTMKSQRKEADKKAAVGQQNSFLMMTPEERQEVYKTGQIGGEDIATAQLKKMIGTNAANDFTAHMDEYLATTDLTQVEDLDTFILAEANKWRAENTDINDPWTLNGFASVLHGYRDKALGAQQTQRVKHHAQQVEAESFKYLQNMFVNAAKGGADPMSVAENLRATYRHVSKDTGLLNNKQLDAQLLDLAGMYADDYPEYSMAILSHIRKDENGKSLGTIADKPDSAVRSKNIVERAKRSIVKKTTASQKQALLQDNVVRLGNDRDYSRYQDVTLADGKVYTAQKQKEDTMDAFRRNLQRQADEKRLSRSEQVTTEAAASSRMNVDMPLIKDELASAPSAFPSTRFAEEGTIEDLDSLASDYAALEASNPTYLRSQLPQESRDWWNAFMAAKRFGGMTETEAAAEFANRSVNGVNKVTLSYNEQDRLRREVEDIGWTNGNYGAFAEDQVETQVRQYMHAGMDFKKALEAAKTNFENVTPKWNDKPIFGMDDQNLPADYQDSINEILNQYVEGGQLPDDIDLDDLQPEFNGANIVFKKPDGQYLPAKNTGLVRISPNDIILSSNVRRDKALEIEAQRGSKVGAGERKSVIEAIEEGNRRIREDKFPMVFNPTE